MRRILASILIYGLVLAPLGAQGVTPGPGDPKAAGKGGTAAAAAPLASAAARMGARLVWDPLTETGYLEREGFHAALRTGFPWLVLDGRDLLRTDPVEVRNGVPYLTEAAASAVAAWFSRMAEERNSHFHIAAILIDPGHGGKDPGAVADHVLEGKKRRVIEKDIALTVALRVRERLAERWPDRKILMTRETDVYPTLEERVDIANSLELGKNDAVIYVSIHANASFNKNARGYEVWYLNPDYRRKVVDDRKLPETDAEILPILNAMMEEEFTTESVLLGFITNAADASLLVSGDHLRKLGDGIYTGIVDFVEYFEKRKGSASP